MGIRRVIGRTVAVSGLIAAIIGWDQLVYAPIAYSHHRSLGLGGVIAELMKPSNEVYSDGIFIGWLLLTLGAVLAVSGFIVALQSLRLMIKYLGQSEVPISVLQTHLTIYIHDDAMTRATVTRQQLFHSNRRGTTAFYHEHIMDSPTGKIDLTTVNIESSLDNKLITNPTLIKRGNAQRLEITEKFVRELPTSWMATYLPNRLVLSLCASPFNLFSGTVVRRTATIDYLNEYNEDNPIIQLSSVRYPVTNVIIEINFPGATTPSAAEIQAYRMTNNAVETIDIHSGPAFPSAVSPGRAIFYAKVKHLDQAKIRVNWENRQLRAYMGARPDTSETRQTQLS